MSKLARRVMITEVGNGWIVRMFLVPPELATVATGNLINTIIASDIDGAVTAAEGFLMTKVQVAS